MKGGQNVLKQINYKGHTLKNGQAYINYNLILNDNGVIKVSERPEYVTKEDGSTGFERTFITNDIPNGVSVRQFLRSRCGWRFDFKRRQNELHNLVY